MDEQMIELIGKLLNKAERAGTDEEAEAFFAKATQLMEKYALDEALIQARRTGATKAEEVVEKHIKFTGSYSAAQSRLGHAVGQAVRCRTIQSQYKSTVTVYLIGYESDVARAETLISSLMIQAQRGLNRFAPKIPPYLSAFEKFRERRDFWSHFAAKVGDRMHVAEQAGAKEYVTERVAAGEDEGALLNSMSVALRDRRDTVNDWVDRKYGRLRYASNRTSSGFGHGAAAGREAGSRADVGQTRVQGGSKQIGPGQ